MGFLWELVKYIFFIFLVIGFSFKWSNDILVWAETAAWYWKLIVGFLVSLLFAAQDWRDSKLNSFFCLMIGSAGIIVLIVGFVSTFSQVCLTESVGWYWSVLLGIPFSIISFYFIKSDKVLLTYLYIIGFGFSGILLIIFGIIKAFI